MVGKNSQVTVLKSVGGLRKSSYFPPNYLQKFAILQSNYDKHPVYRIYLLLGFEGIFLMSNWSRSIFLPTEMYMTFWAGRRGLVSTQASLLQTPCSHRYVKSQTSMEWGTLLMQRGMRISTFLLETIAFRQRYWIIPAPILLCCLWTLNCVKCRSVACPDSAGRSGVFWVMLWRHHR